MLAGWLQVDPALLGKADPALLGRRAQPLPYRLPRVPTQNSVGGPGACPRLASEVKGIKKTNKKLPPPRPTMKAGPACLSPSSLSLTQEGGPSLMMRTASRHSRKRHAEDRWSLRERVLVAASWKRGQGALPQPQHGQAWGQRIVCIPIRAPPVPAVRFNCCYAPA